MLNHVISVNSEAASLEQAGIDRLQAALAGIPFLKSGDPLREQSVSSAMADFTLPIEAHGQPWTLVCEVKHSGQPRYVREGAFQLRKYLKAMSSDRAYGVFIAPFLSDESTALLREESLGYLDFAGNCFLCFDGIFVERSGSPHTPERRRELREIFAPKASRVLRILFTDPHRSWRVAELAEQAAVSVGQVSNVRRALLDREWASADARGLKLQKPGTILDAWRSAYAPRLAHEDHYYTLLHGDALISALRAAFEAASTDTHLLLASFSAAQWLAPFARMAGTFLYADMSAAATLQDTLQLQHASRGANVTVATPKDDSVFIDSREPSPGLRCTGALQTYLDLSSTGDRGREAADHLRQHLLEPQWSAPRLPNS